MRGGGQEGGEEGGEEGGGRQGGRQGGGERSRRWTSLSSMPTGKGIQRGKFKGSQQNAQNNTQATSYWNMIYPPIGGNPEGMNSWPD